MKHILIIEDEVPAAEKLIHFVRKFDQTLLIHGPIPSIEEAIHWLNNPKNKSDLIFMDIYLADGPCFDIFKQTEIQQPIIFTTAYNEYALEAFKHNSIAYLLKPISYSDFSDGMQQFKRMQTVFSGSQTTQASILELLSNISTKATPTYKSRFMVKSGERIRSIPLEDIAIFYAEGRTAFLYTNTQRKYIVDYTLAELESILDPALFFRVNRSFLVQISAIQEVLQYSNSRLKLALHVGNDFEIIVSREKVPFFKAWFDGNGIV